MRNHVGHSLSRTSGPRASNSMWNRRLCGESNGSPFPSLSAGQGQQGGEYLLGGLAAQIHGLSTDLIASNSTRTVAEAAPTPSGLVGVPWAVRHPAGQPPMATAASFTEVFMQRKEDSR